MTDETAFVNDHLEPTDDFDWSIVDDADRQTVQREIRRQSFLALAKLMHRMLELGGRNRNQLFIAANCFSFAAHLHPNQDEPGEELAEKLNLTKQAFFKRVNTCRDILGLPHMVGTSRSPEARKKFKRTAKKHHEKIKRTHSTKPAGTFLDRLNDSNR